MPKRRRQAKPKAKPEACTIHYVVLDRDDLDQTTLSNFPGTSLDDLRKAIKAQEGLSGSASGLKLWVAMPGEVRRGTNMKKLQDENGNLDFSELLKRYELGFKNPISVELPALPAVVPPLYPQAEDTLPETIQELCAKLGKEFETLPASFNPHNLSTLLLTDLQTKIVCGYDVPPEAIPYAIKGSCSNANIRASRLIANIIHTYDDFKCSGRTTEDSLHVYWDEIILQTIALFANSQICSLEYSRNSVDMYQSGTTQLRTRPDFLCWMKEALILRGEEKGSSNDFIEAQTELRSKFGTWNALHYGRLPFVLAYATGGFYINFYMFTKDNQCRSIFSDRLNTNLLSARLQVFKIIVNIVRIFRTLGLFLPPDRGIRLFSQLDRPNGVRLIFHPHCVEKIIPASARCMTDEEFHFLYNHIWNEKPANIINLHSPANLGRTQTHLKLIPLGFSQEPTSVADLKSVVIDILKGLKWLHDIGFVHRDVRWSNVVRKPDGQFMLIDLELAGKAGYVDFRLASWPEFHGDQYLKEMDLMMLGNMISEYAYLDTDEVGIFRGQGLKEILLNGCTAKVAMMDQWLLNICTVEVTMVDE